MMLKHKISIVIWITAAPALTGCKPKPSPPPPPLVEVITVKQEDVPIYHEWIGSLDGLVNAEIRAQVTGYLIAQNYKEDDPIKKGGLLFEIDPRPFQAVLDQAKGQLAEAEARQGKTELDVKLYGPLVKDRAISQEEYDDAVQANLEAKAAVVAAKAQVEQAGLNLEFTKITSPIDGVASIAKAQLGNLVGQYHQAKAAKDEAILHYRQTIIFAFRDVSDALISRQQLAEIRDQQATEVTSLERRSNFPRRGILPEKRAITKSWRRSSSSFPPN